MKPKPFGKYYLLERVNVGGMAEVFKAKQFGSDGFERLVAIKRILPNIAEDEEFITMFVDEAKIAVKLNHPNIAQIYELDKVDGIYYIAMEFIHGKDLRTIFERLRAEGKTIEIGMACYIIMKVCEGLDYAHNKKDEMGREMGIVHRDISPQNVLISYEGDVKIIDFGIAKAAGKASKTQAGILKGKFGYMSPEQVRGLPLDRRSDIFSLGIVLYELLTGERLFVGESDFSTLEKVRNVEILPPTTYNRSIPEELERIVLKALEKEPENRYQTAAQMHEELQAFMYTSGVFFSRKDLAAWMKMAFARELLEEQKKLEEYQQLKPPPEILTYNSGGHAPAPRKEERRGIVIGSGDLDWEDEEIETQLYDKPPGGGSISWEDEPEVIQSADVLEAEDAEEHEHASYAPRPKEGLAPKRTLMGMGAVQPGASAPSQGNRMEPAAPDWMAEPKKSGPTQTPQQPQPAQNKAAPAAAWPEHPQPQPASHNWGMLVGLVALLVAGAGAIWFLVINKRASAKAVLEIKPEPAVGTQVVINGEIYKITSRDGIRIKKEPGSYEVKIVHQGYKTEKRKITVDAGKSVLWEPILKPGNVSISIVGLPGDASVRIDGTEYREKTPWTGMAIKPGRHTITISKGDTFYPFEKTVEARPGEVLNIKYTLYPKKVTVTVPVDGKGATVCITQSADAPPAPSECSYQANVPFEFQPEKGKTYYLVVARKGYEQFRTKMELAGKNVWSPSEGKVVLKKSPLAPVPAPKMAQNTAPSSIPAPPPPAPPAVTVGLTSRKNPSPRVVVAPPPVMTRKPVRTMAPMISSRPKPPMISRPRPKPRSGGGTGKVMFLARPRAQIFVDGAPRGYTPRKLTLSAGRHKITLINNGRGLRKTIYVTVRPGSEMRKVVNLGE